MNELVCYLFDRVHVQATLSQVDPIIGAAVSRCFEGDKLYLIAFSDKGRPAIEISRFGELYAEVQKLLPLKDSIQWKLWIKAGSDVRRVFVDTWGEDPDDPDVDLD